MSISDFNKIATNTYANKSIFEINKNQKKLIKEMQRLATGLKNPRAEDDSASFSIAAKLSSRIAGINQAKLNVGDAKSMLDIMEQSLTKIADILYEVKKLVTSAANGTNGPEEIDYIKRSINGLAGEITSIIEQTTYNNNQILIENYSASFQVGELASQTLSLSIDQDLTAQDVQVEEVTTLGVLSTAGTLTTATNLNALNEYAGIQGGDTFDIILTQGDGTQTTVAFTAAGAKGALTTSTVQSLMDAINGTGTFVASYSADEGGEIIVRESVVSLGNALAVNFTNYVEADNVDGATGGITFSFDSASGNIRSNFTPSGTYTAGTNVNSITQFTDIEGQDTLAINLVDRSGTTTTVNYTFAGASAVATTSTLGNIVTAINAQAGAKFSASIVSGQIEIEELNKGQNSLSSSASFIENSTDTGAASVSNSSFAQTTRTVRLNQAAAINAGTLLTDGVAGILSGATAALDNLQITLVDNTGAAQVINYSLNGADTFQDLATYISANSNFTATISGNNFLVTEDTLQEGTSLSISFTGLSGAGVLNNPGSISSGDTILTAKGAFGSGYNTGTALNSLAAFTNVQSGDTLTLNLTNNLGAAQNVNFTFAGGLSGASTSTINDLISAINAQTTLTASFNASLGEIQVVDPVNSGTAISLAINNANFTELARPNNGSINLSFSPSGENMVSNTMTQISNSATITTATSLNNITGWGTLQGNDIIRINLRTRAGVSSNFDFTLNDVGAGVNTNLTVNDLVSFINNRSIGSVNFEASLIGGQIVIGEENSPAVGGFGGSTSYTEFNIDATPKQFSNTTFQVRKFLELADDTGLAIGLGILDFNSGTQLTQSTSQALIRNVDDSINRVVDQLNKFGVFQESLSIRENILTSSGIAHESARSRIRDVDYARAQSEMIKAQILQRYQTASLTQANLAPQYLLALI